MFSFFYLLNDLNFFSRGNIGLRCFTGKGRRIKLQLHLAIRINIYRYVATLCQFAK